MILPRWRLLLGSTPLNKEAFWEWYRTIRRSAIQKAPWRQRSAAYDRWLPRQLTVWLACLKWATDLDGQIRGMRSRICQDRWVTELAGSPCCFSLGSARIAGERVLVHWWD